MDSNDWLTAGEEENSDKYLEARDGRYFCLTLTAWLYIGLENKMICQIIEMHNNKWGLMMVSCMVTDFHDCIYIRVYNRIL